jgi:hypothetical protein
MHSHSKGPQEKDTAYHQNGQRGRQQKIDLPSEAPLVLEIPSHVNSIQVKLAGTRRRLGRTQCLSPFAEAAS